MEKISGFKKTFSPPGQRGLQSLCYYNQWERHSIYKWFKEEAVKYSVGPDSLEGERTCISQGVV